MGKRFGKGVLMAIGAGVIGYLSMLLGSIVTASTGSNILGGIIALPGFIYAAPGLPFVNLIDYLPMYLIFPKGGASGVFGSILLFALVFWSLLFGFLSVKQKWPFKP